MLLFKFPSGPLSTNAILFGDGGVAAVIDPAQGSTQKILAQANNSGLTIEKILLTHSHWDHIVDLQAIQRETGAFVYVHRLDAPNVEAPGSDGIPLYFPIPPVQPDHFLEDGEIVHVGALKLKVIHTPGHSPGGVCFYLEEQKILFAGDTLFKGTYGRLDSPTGDEESMRRSLHKLALLPPDTRVISGHGSDTEIGKEAWLSKVDLI